MNTLWICGYVNVNEIADTILSRSRSIHGMKSTNRFSIHIVATAKRPVKYAE